MTDRRVLFFGDSHTAGVGDPSGIGWVGRVASASYQHRLPLTSYNLGVRGDTSLDVLRRWRREAAARVTPEIDCRVVFAFGANDTASEPGSPRVPLTRSREALQRALDEAAELGLPTFVVGPAPLQDHERNRRISALSSAFADVCDRRGVQFADVFGPLRSSPVWRGQVNASDGAHPGASGYAELADRVLRSSWLSWLQGPAATDAAGRSGRA